MVVVDQRAIALTGTRTGPRRDVGPVDREVEDEELERLAQAGFRKIARGIMTGGNPGEQAHQHGELARQHGLEHAPLGFLQHRLERRRRIAGLAPDIVEFAEPVRIEQHARDRIEPFIARCAADTRKAGQCLVLAEDFLDPQWEGLACRALRLEDQPAQPHEVLRGILQPVDVIEPQALDLVLGDETLHQHMDAIESAAVFDAQPSQRVDVEEAAIVDLAGRETPIGEAVMLSLEQVMKRGGRGGVLRVRAIGGEPCCDQAV